MSPPPSAFSRQALAAVAAAIGLLAAIAAWGVVSAISMGDLQSQFESKSRTLEILTRQVRSRFSGRDGHAQLEPSAEAFSAPSETVAASELQKSILRVLEGAGGAVHSVQAEATTDVIGEGLRRLTAQITFDGSIDALQKVLFGLETGIPFIFVDSILVQAAAMSTAGTRPGETLRVTLVASSYWKGPEASSQSH